MRSLAVLLTLSAAALPAAAGLFSTVEPELIYTGSGTDLGEGVLVVRDAAALQQALQPLDPAFGGAAPDIDKRTVLRIAGRPRENRCRDTRLIEVSTRGTTATVKLQEQVPAAECPCEGAPRPPKVYLVTVGRSVRSAEIVKTDVVVPCAPEEVAKAKAAKEATMVFEGAWDGSPGAKVIIEQPEYKTVLAKLGIADRGPAIDFEKERVIAVTGRPRENGCRRTNVLAAKVVNPEEVEFEVEEVYAVKGQQCAQVITKPRLFLYRVPATVMRAKVTTREVR